MLEQRVGLADQLHVAIFDAVVHHLHVVAGTPRPDPVAARDVALGAHLGGDRLEDRLHERPCGPRPTGHQARPLEGPFLAAGDAGADVEQPGRLDFLRAAFGVGIERVAAIDDDVAGSEERQEGLDQLVDSRARLHHHHHLPRRLEGGHEVFERVAADDIRLVAPAGSEGVGDARRAVVDGDRIPAAGDVEGQVFPHHRQADQSDITRCLCRHAPFPVGSRSFALQ